jgi:hypothetical protein
MLTGDEARGHGRGAVDGLELEDGRGHYGKWGVLRSLRSGPERSVRQGLQRGAQGRWPHRAANHARRCPRWAQVPSFVKPFAINN